MLLAAPASAQSFDPKKSQDQVNRYVDALNRCDTAALADVLDPSITSFGIRGAFGSSRPVYVQVVEIGCRAGTKLSMTPKILRHEEIGDAALSVLEATGTSVTAGRSTPLDLRLTLVLKRGTDQAWRIVHSQMATAF